MLLRPAAPNPPKFIKALGPPRGRGGDVPNGITKLNSFGVFGFVKCLRFVGGIDVAAVDLMFYLCGISWIFIREGNLTRMAFT